MPCKHCQCARCLKFYEAKAVKALTLHIPNEVNIIMDIFQRINPFLNYGHKGNRKAVEELIAKLGLEKTQKISEYAISVQGQDFAPVISTPFQLKEKFNALMEHYRKNKQAPKVVKL